MHGGMAGLGVAPSSRRKLVEGPSPSRQKIDKGIGGGKGGLKGEKNCVG